MMKKVHSNIIAQDCYIRDITPKVVKKSEYAERRFSSLVEVPDSIGVHYELHDFDYPITPESVKSYVDSTDYKRDPAAAIAVGSRGVNFGDITELQRITNSDVSAVRLTLERIQKAAEASAGSAPFPADNLKNDEVKSNE